MPGPGEPLWLPEDTDKALAYEMSLTEGCPRCHRRREDYFDADGNRHDPPLLEPVGHRCPFCADTGALEAAIRSRAESDPANAQVEMAGRYVRIERFDPDRDVFGDE